MAISARDIDHLTVALADPEGVAAKFQQLGFTLTPEGAESRCICFQPDRDDIPSFIELMEGEISGATLAINAAELEGEHRAYRWETEDGALVDAEMVVGQGGGPLPWLPVKHLTPNAFMEPEWIVHANGALALMAIHAVSDDPRATARDLKVAWKATMEEIFDGCCVVKTGAAELLIWSPPAYQIEYKVAEVMAPERKPSIVGMAIAIERPRPLQALLRANNVPFAIAEGDRIVVPPEQAGGLMIEFIPQT